MSLRRSLLIGLLIYGFVLSGLGTLSGSFLAVAVPLALYLAAVLVYRPYDVRLRIYRRLSHDHVRPATKITVDLVITNDGEDLEELLIEDEVPAGLTSDGDTSLLLSLPSGASHTLTYHVEGARGSYRFEQTQVTVSERFGLFRRQRPYPVHSRLSVLPASPSLRSLKIRPARTRGFAGPIPSRQGGSGTDFYGVRSYEPGDPPQWINWRLSARHPREIYTNQFEQERIADVGLILDARERTNVSTRDSSLFEHSVEVTAALADSFLHDGNRVGLLVYGRGLERTFPGYGKLQRQRILYALAMAQVGDSLVFDSLDYLPTRFFAAKSQLVLVSPLCDDDPPVLTRLRARGYQILVISPDPVDFERRGQAPSRTLDMAIRIAQAERQLRIRQLERVGVVVINWQVGQALDATVQAGLKRYLPQALRG